MPAKLKKYACGEKKGPARRIGEYRHNRYWTAHSRVHNLRKCELCKSKLCRYLCASIVNSLRATVLEPCLFTSRL